MAMDERGLGKRLQAARQNAGLTQQQLCHKANLSFSTLTKIERGAIKSPSIFTIQSIAGALNVGLDELVGQQAKSLQKHRTRSGVSFIYFDVNGCLVYFFQGAFAKLSHDSGVPADIVEAAFWHYNDEACRGQLSPNDFNLKFSEKLGIDLVNWEDYYLAAIEPIEEMHQVVKWAAEKYNIGLLTNILPGFLHDMMQRQLVPALDYQAVVDSSQVGAIKPELAIYETAQERAGVPADQILLIDDSRPNVMAAEKLGWHVLWFDGTRSEEMSDRVRQALEPAD
jgi:FMN phosphatase YigB (HAD superfamily)/DNA-binding XRE family transcriptional regulator